MPIVSANTAAQVAAQGARSLARLVLPDGRFIYRYRAAEQPKAGRKYNVLRHCGTAWSMLDVARQLGSLEDVATSAKHAVHHMIENFLFPYGREGALCVVDDGKIKLGGNGLALLALAELFELTRDEELINVGQRLARYIVSEQRPDGDFVHSRDFRTGKERDFRSDYYTGEALFGLLRLHEVTGEKRWLQTAVSSEAVLHQSGYGVSAQSHWMLYALERLYLASRSEIYLEHARRIAEHVLLFPDYRKQNRSTPIACRSEGLLAYIRMLHRAGPDAMASQDAGACLREVRKNLSLQMQFRTAAGEFIRGGGSDEVRIDYIQHNISSFLAYGRLQASLRNAA
jgi:hypothetical protein